MSRSLATLAFVAGLVLVSCGERGDIGGGSDDGSMLAMQVSNMPRLNDGAPGPQALASRAITAIMAHDTASLARLLVTKEEFMRHIYPEYGMHYPAARDTSTLAREFIWENQTLSTYAALNQILRQLDGRKMDLIDVRFNDGTRRFASYSIHEGTITRVRFDDGRQADLHALGSMIEMDGVYKLISYRDR